MTRLPAIDLTDCSPDQRDAIDEWLRERGQPNPPGALWRMLVAAPTAMRAVGKLGAYVRVDTTIDPLLQEVGAFIASEARGFAFEINIHARKLAALGVDPEAILAANDGRPTGLGEGPDAVAALAYAMASRGSVSAESVARAKAAVGTEQLIEFITVVAYFLMIGDLARVLEPDE